MRSLRLVGICGLRMALSVKTTLNCRVLVAAEDTTRCEAWDMSEQADLVPGSSAVALVLVGFVGQIAAVGLASLQRR